MYLPWCVLLAIVLLDTCTFALLRQFAGVHTLAWSPVAFVSMESCGVG